MLGQNIVRGDRIDNREGLLLSSQADKQGPRQILFRRQDPQAHSPAEIFALVAVDRRQAHAYADAERLSQNMTVLLMG